MKHNIKTYETANTTPVSNLTCVSEYVSKAVEKNSGWFIGMHAIHKGRLWMQLIPTLPLGNGGFRD